MTFSLAYDETLSRVRVSVTNVPAGANVVHVERSTDQITWATVRGGQRAEVTGGQALVDDYEFTAGEPNYYRVTPLQHEDFTTSAIALDVTGTWTRDDTEAHSGQWAYRSPDIADSGSADADVAVPAAALTLTFWHLVSAETPYDTLGLLVDGTSQGDLPAETWTEDTVDVSAATTVTFRYSKDGSISQQLDAAFVDDVAFTFATDGPQQITPTLGTVWLKFIARPFLNTSVTVTDWSEVERPARNGIFEVLGRSMPIAVTGPRSSRRYTLTVMFDTPDKAESFDYVLAAGDPVFVHIPPDCGLPRSMYAVIGDTTQSRKMIRSPRRYFELPLTEVAAPGPGIVGATVTWSDIVASFATWADLVAAEATWADVTERITDPSVVIVP